MSLTYPSLSSLAGDGLPGVGSTLWGNMIRKYLEVFLALIIYTQPRKLDTLFVY